MTADKKALEALHAALATVLTTKVKGDEVTAADLNVARQFLKDNGIGLVHRANEEELDKLREALPFKSASALAEEDQTFN